MKFGVKELREFAENHKDERVRVLFKRLEESRRKNAAWCQKVAELEDKIESMRYWHSAWKEVRGLK